MSIVSLFACAPHKEESERPTNRLEQLEVTDERQWYLTDLLPGDELEGKQFGFDVAVSGTTAAIGAPQARAVYVFVLAADGWHQQDKLEGPADEAPRFGRSVAISGDTLIVGGAAEFGTVPGTAYAYVRDGTTWGNPVRIDAEDRAAGDEFGASVDISGDNVVVGAPMATTGVSEAGYEGAAYLFARSGTSWLQRKKFFADSPGFAPEFGRSVAVFASSSETTVLVGAPGENGANGAAYFFTSSSEGWEAQQVASHPPHCCDRFGSSVAIGEQLALIGLPHYRERGTTLVDHQGAAFAYTKTGTSWSLLTDALFAEDPMEYDEFGTAVAVSGRTAMVGAPGTGGMLGDANSVFVFSPLTSSSVQARIGARGEVPILGGSVSLDGDTAAIGTLYGQTGAYVAELLVVDGGACGDDSQCRARHCVAGICCNEPCSGECETCSTGTCTPLPNRPALPECPGYRCAESGGACQRTCASNLDCADTHYCRDHECVEKVQDGGDCALAYDCVSGTCDDGTCAGSKAIGVRCSKAADCESGFCADRYCCDQRCSGQCEACDVSGALGTCTPVEGSPRGDRAACEGAGSVCGGECDGEHTAGCRYETGTPCGSECANDEQTDSTCNGRGACQPGRSRACEPYRCANDSRCADACSDSADCAEGFTCLNEVCTPGSTCRDEHTSQSPNGDEEDCGSYLCRHGTCLTGCTEHTDCAEDYACDQGRCVSLPSSSAVFANDERGCSCSSARPGSSRFWVLLGFVVLLARRARRDGCRRDAQRRLRESGQPRRARRGP